MPFFFTGNVGDKPFNFENVKKHAEEKLNADFSQPEKMVMIGNRLYQDILFGKLNKMPTICITDFDSTNYHLFE